MGMSTADVQRQTSSNEEANIVNYHNGIRGSWAESKFAKDMNCLVRLSC